MTVLLIVLIALMGIGFPFKRDIEICLSGVAILQQPHQPFPYIPYKEPYEQQFTLLQGVYAFVALFRRGKALLGKYHATEVDGVEILAKGEYGIKEYYLLLLNWFAGEVHAEFLEYLSINFGQHYCGMYLATL